MNVYLTLIGIISTISCVLIIICINSKSYDPNSLPTERSKSPIRRQGLTQAQKSQILLIICVIFFMSLVTTNVKTSKFSVIFKNFASSSQESNAQHVTDLRQIFYGDQGSCKYKSQDKKYPNLVQYLKKGQKYQKFIQILLQKNHKQQTLKKDQQKRKEQPNYHPQLIIYISTRKHPGTQAILPQLSQQTCKQTSQKTPTLYLNILKSIQSQQELMSLLKIQNYQTLKQSLCMLNGIQIKRQTQIIGRFSFQKQTYSQVGKVKSYINNAYLVINNFQFLKGVLIFDRSIKGRDRVKLTENRRKQHEQVQAVVNIVPNYELFVDKLMSDLILNCKVNVILHTDKRQEVNILYENWKALSQHKFTLNSQGSESSQPSNIWDQQFPFSVKSWRGITKIQFHQLLKQLIISTKSLKDRQNQVWRVFQNHFGAIQRAYILKTNSVTSGTVQSSLVQNSQQLTLGQLEQFFTEIQGINSQDQVNDVHYQRTKYDYNDANIKISQFYGLQDTYLIIKSMSNSKLDNLDRGIRIGQLKRKTPLQNLNKLEQLGFIYIKQGKVYLLR